MDKIQVFDPAMCCNTGVCGPEVDPSLVTFAADLEWLKAQGIQVERINLAQQPQRFAQHDAIRQLLETQGETALPAIVVNGEIKQCGNYPSREQLAEWAGPPVGGFALHRRSGGTGGARRRHRVELRALLQIPLRPGAQAGSNGCRHAPRRGSGAASQGNPGPRRAGTRSPLPRQATGPGRQSRDGRERARKAKVDAAGLAPAKIRRGVQMLLIRRSAVEEA